MFYILTSCQPASTIPVTDMILQHIAAASYSSLLEPVKGLQTIKVLRVLVPPIDLQ